MKRQVPFMGPSLWSLFVLCIVPIALGIHAGCARSEQSGLTSQIGVAPSSLSGTAVHVRSQSGGSSVVDDPIGDSQAASPYLDIVKSKITTEVGQDRLFFMMEVAGAIPQAPSEPFASWSFAFGNPATFTGGGTFDYAIAVRWCGQNPPTPPCTTSGAFQGLFLNRTGGTLVVTPLPFEIDGATVKWHVDLAQIGNPTIFSWDSAARTAPPPQPEADRAPDFGLGFGTWSR